jgi:hypothetical protein
MKIIANKDIDDVLMGKICELEVEVFGPDLAVGPELLTAHHRDRQGIFCLLDDKGDPIAFIDVLFLSQEQTTQYLADGDYWKLQNLGFRVADDNIMYLFGLALKKEYRGSGVMKYFIKPFVKWVCDLEARGVKMKYVFAETTSQDGTRFARAMGMIPVDETKIKSDGLGFYYSPDNLAGFIKKFV